MIILGIDESGTGAWAGPYTVGAVALDDAQEDELRARGVGDSKARSDRKRRDLVHDIAELSELMLVEVVSVQQIDAHRGSNRAWVLAVNALIKQACDLVPACHKIIIDGNIVRGVDPLGRHLIFRHKADRDVVSVGAASIIAKTLRNDIMNELALEHPAYKWNENYGYVSAEHKAIVVARGLTPHHRMIKPSGA